MMFHWDGIQLHNWYKHQSYYTQHIVVCKGHILWLQWCKCQQGIWPCNDHLPRTFHGNTPHNFHNSDNAHSVQNSSDRYSQNGRSKWKWGIGPHSFHWSATNYYNISNTNNSRCRGRSLASIVHIVGLGGKSSQLGIWGCTCAQISRIRVYSWCNFEQLSYTGNMWSYKGGIPFLGCNSHQGN